ncbi:YbaK/EbsC family protein [Glutamicibacter sp. PS]|uniref:aminoacyl-tRNA deacylase n=1 Tax=Glutamicibacter sp. PS TaxID=3075634 RepID=UPI002849D1A7|nr:YbaK/EbsC family protein [Glutamicibacter sp. PS]MDR4533322.1 YbaK/EbsC family protein [Glutamicibacter sp. PS]
MGTDAKTPQNPAIAAVQAAAIEYSVTRHGPVASLQEAAQARGVSTADLLKTLVVRRAADDYVLVLVPGDRRFSWTKLRALLGTNRLSMPDAAEAQRVTGYERGTITPFGTRTILPVIADAHIVGRQISLGGGEHGVGLNVAADDVIRLFEVTLADISDQAPGSAS